MQDDDALMQDGMADSFFSKKFKDEKKIQERVQRNLIEITVDGGENFYISELFYSLLFKH